MRDLIVSLRVFLFMTFALGVCYPAVVTLMGQAFFADKANGQILYRADRPVGSKLIAQNFERADHFWPRPSAINFNPIPSGGSNSGPTSAELKKLVDERTAKLRAAHGDHAIPQDLLFASASGLDPEISPEAAVYQAKRVADARRLDFADVIKLIEGATSPRQLGFLGEPRVNVLALNLSLEESSRHE